MYCLLGRAVKPKPAAADVGSPPPAAITQPVDAPTPTATPAGAPPPAAKPPAK